MRTTFGRSTLIGVVVAGLMGSTGQLTAQERRYTEAEARASLQKVVRKGGAWVTSNARYWSDESGEPREYLMSFRSDAEGLAVRGCMWGRSGSAATTPFWSFFQAWDPAAGAILAYQANPAGIVSIGHERPYETGGSETIQEMTTRDGNVVRSRHLNRPVHADTLASQSFAPAANEGWAPRRSYTWVWTPGVTSVPCFEQSPSAGDPDSSALSQNPLGFMEPLVGTWVPDKGWLDENPGMDALVPFAFEWGPNRYSLSYRAALPDKEGTPFTMGTIVWNPDTRKAEFMSSQGNDALQFEGYYEPVDEKTIRRVYTVSYPNRSPLRYRETFFLITRDTLDWLTEWQPEGAWVPRRGSGDPEMRATRAPAAPVELHAFERLIGDWRPDPERIPAPMADWRSRLGVTDEFASFQWGTGSRWIEFGEHREQNGAWRIEGSGIIAFDPHIRAVTYVEHTDTGVTLRGTLVVVDSNTIQRHYRSYYPDGTLRSWVDTWRWEDPDDLCFEWTTNETTDPSDGTSRPGYWVCRTS